MRDNSLDTQVGGHISQLVLSHVHQDSKVLETINIHWKLRRRPRLRVSECVPYVEIGVS